MSLDGAPLTPHRQLLLDDARQSLTGLSVSLSQDSPGLPQASLHARDLAHALALADLAPLAELVEALSQRLAKGEEGAIFLGRGLAGLVAQWIEKARTGQSPQETAAAEGIEAWRERLLRPQSASPDQLPPIDNLTDPVLQPLALQGLEAEDIHGMGLKAVAAIRGQLADPGFSPKGLDVQLSALEDWLVSLGQYALSDIYPGPPHQVVGAWADASLVGFLRSHLDWAYRSRLIRAATLNLTLRLDWVDARLQADELQVLGHEVAQLEGRIQALAEGGWRLWLPACRRRMHLQTFVRDGQAWAVSAALVEAAPDPAARVLRLRLGASVHDLAVDSIGRQASMNLHPIPAVVPMPPEVRAVAVDPATGLFPMLRIDPGRLP